MHPLTAEWIAKTEADFVVMEREGRVRKIRPGTSVCFHAQQCAEKYLKGTLAESDLEIGRVHDLVTLLERLLPTHPLWEAFRIDLAHLSDFAVAYRYPGDSATRQQARDAIRRVAVDPVCHIASTGSSFRLCRLVILDLEIPSGAILVPEPKRHLVEHVVRRRCRECLGYPLSVRNPE